MADVRFALDRGCSVATPHGGGTGGLGQLRHNLAHYYDVANTATNNAANKVGDHLFISESVCFVGCLSINMQGNTIYGEANAWSWNIISKKPRQFFGFTAGFNSATTQEALRNNLNFEGCLASEEGACVGSTANVTSKGMGPMRPYAGFVVGSGFQLTGGYDVTDKLFHVSW